MMITLKVLLLLLLVVVVRVKGCRWGAAEGEGESEGESDDSGGDGGGGEDDGGCGDCGGARYDADDHDSNDVLHPATFMLAPHFRTARAS